MLVASFSETLDNFAAIMNFVIFPVFFLSGSLYPIQSLPPLLRNIAEVNPYTYGVDILKHAILVPNGMAADFPLLNSVGFLLIFTVLAFFISSWRFSQEKVSANWFPRKRRK
jgi:ABC-2 type transport system permease protein